MELLAARRVLIGDGARACHHEEEDADQEERGEAGDGGLPERHAVRGERSSDAAVAACARPEWGFRSGTYNRVAS